MNPSKEIFAEALPPVSEPLPQRPLPTRVFVAAGPLPNGPGSVVKQDEHHVSVLMDCDKRVYNFPRAAVRRHPVVLHPEPQNTALTPAQIVDLLEWQVDAGRIAAVIEAFWPAIRRALMDYDKKTNSTLVRPQVSPN
jgi:hypothetical protein